MDSTPYRPSVPKDKLRGCQGATQSRSQSLIEELIPQLVPIRPRFPEPLAIPQHVQALKEDMLSIFGTLPYPSDATLGLKDPGGLQLGYRRWIHPWRRSDSGADFHYGSKTCASPFPMDASTDATCAEVDQVPTSLSDPKPALS